MKRISILFVLLLSFIFLYGCGDQKNMDKDLISQKTNVIDTVFKIPHWASEINIFAPENLVFDQANSNYTSEDVDGFNSINYVYHGDYNIALQEAEKIAKLANIPLSADFKMAQEILSQTTLQDNYSQEIIGDLKGILYTNYTLMSKPTGEYVVSIAVDENGKLELIAYDWEKMEEVIDLHIQ